MSSKPQTVENIKKYESKLKSADYHVIDAFTASDHEQRLDNTIEELNARIEKERAALNDLKIRTKAADIAEDYHSDPSAQLRQIQIIKNAYTDLTPAEPLLPGPNSVLPSLLALRAVAKLIPESREAIESSHAFLKVARSRLAKEQSDLSDSQLITEHLEKRIETLRKTSSLKDKQAPDEVARNLVQAETTRKDAYKSETNRKLNSLIHFISETLAPMLAVEELGGPLVGEMLEVSEEILAAGFTDKHKPKRGKALTADKRQLRIDEIWGENPEDADDQFIESSRTESKAASDETKYLVNELLNQSWESGSGSWITLDRDSALARFLVRCGVCVMHPRDGMRIRLVDFGRDGDN